MHTVTARAIRRANPLHVARQSSMAGFIKFLAEKKATFNFNRKRPFGHRVMFSTRRWMTFAAATFAHPTKKTTAGRISTVAWQLA